MDRNREVRRGSMAAASANGLTKRRPRSSSLRDSPEDDGQLELQETARLRDRGVKKDRDRDRDRDRERDRSSRNKRRRGDRLMHGGNNREDGVEDSSEESVNDEDEDDEDEGGGGGGPMRMLPPNPMASISSSLSNHHHQQPRKSFQPSSVTTTKVFRPVQGWKPADEMIGFSVPRKARSASTKRSHECSVSGSGAGGEQIHPQTSTSPVRPSLPLTPSPAPISPSSSNASGRKKMKPNGPKQRPPKSSSKSSSSNPEELEIEIAEVLYGLMTQSQGPSKKETLANDSAKFDSREVNKLSSDAKSRVSSPISNSTSTAAPQSAAAVLPQNSSSSATPLAVVAPKRKRPRQVSENLGTFSVRNSSTTAPTMKAEIDQPLKTEISSPNLEKNTGSAAENGSVPHDFAGFQACLPPSVPPPSPESGRQEPGNAIADSKPAIEESRESRDVDRPKEEAVTSPKMEPTVVRPEDDREDDTASKANSTISEIETHREEKFQIDLMASPPQSRSSPEREAADIDLVAAAEHKPAVPHSDAEMRPMVKDKEEENAVKGGSGKDEAVNVVEPELKKAKATAEGESEKPVVRNIDLQLDLEKPERDSDTGDVNGNKLKTHVQKQQQQLPKAVKDEPPHTEKTVQTSSLPLPMSMASWPGGLPPMGYMAPLQGVVSMDGSPVPSTPIQPLVSQPRPKRCATHCYLARSIHYLQLMKMSPFWPAAAGSASIYGAKACNLNVVPPAELHGNIAGRNVNPVQDKSQGLAIFPGHSGKDKSSQAANIADAQRNQQILLQQALPPGAPPSNILHGPTFIFPLNQPPAAAAASVRPGSVKSPTAAGTGASSSTSNSASVNGSATAAPVGFNYQNIHASETQYLAILPNNAYTFPLPGVGAPSYRGTHAQMPYINGSFYSSQMIHPSQQQQQPSSLPLQMQQSHQNTSISSGSSSSQKHMQSQQQRPQSTNTNGGNGSASLHGFPAQKIRPSQQRPSQHMSLSHQTRQPESEVGGEDSPSTADSRVSRPKINVYGQNFTFPIHHQNFALLTPHSAVAGASGGGSQGEKKQPQQTQQVMKAGAESLAPQTFAMSFAPINGSTAPGIDISSMAQSHAVFQSSPDARHSYQQIMAVAAAAQAAQQKKNFRVSEEGRTGGGDSSSMDEEKKGLMVKAPATVGHSIAFSGPELADPSVPGGSVIDSSNRTLNLVSAPPRTSRSSMSTFNPPNSQLQYQQQQQMMQMQKHQQLQQQQQQQQLVAARNKTPVTSNGIAYSDHLTSSSSAAAAAKFPSALSAFPQSLVQSSSSSSSSLSQSPQWKNSARATQQVPASLASSTTSLKNLSQQQPRTQQTQTQISFGGSQKSIAPQGHQVPTSHQSPSPPMVVGSPTTSSISKGASGSPRTITSASQGNKPTQPSALSSQQSKNSASVSSQKSSPVGGRNVPSILGNPHITSSTTGTKPQMQQQQQQQQQQHQLPKQTVQQSQLFFSPAYLPPQNPHSTGASSTASATSGYYLHNRRRPEQQQQSQQPQGSSTSSSTGMLPLCPVTLASASTSDAKAAAAAASNMKGSGLPSQGILHPAQFTSQSTGNSHQLVPGFSYVPTIPAAVQVKPAEQKQPAGNHHCLTRK